MGSIRTKTIILPGIHINGSEDIGVDKSIHYRQVKLDPGEYGVLTIRTETIILSGFRINGSEDIGVDKSVYYRPVKLAPGRHGS
jgi:hypothetical protein